MEEALRARLLANSSIAALVSKVAWGVRPQGSALPAITLTKSGSARGYTFSGASGLQASGVQFDIWALKESEARAVFRALLAEMETADKTVSETVFGMSFLQDEQGSSEEVPGVGTVYRIRADFTVWHKPT